MAEPTLADILIGLAEQDALAFRKLFTDPEIHDALIGFHAQQAVEKSLKAVLSHAGVVFRRTHDIAELLDLLSDASLPTPPHAERLDELNPYAVEMRYGLVGPGGLDRDATNAMIDAVLAWARTTRPHS
jgi:HEPN domain-containing protein